MEKVIDIRNARMRQPRRPTTMYTPRQISEMTGVPYTSVLYVCRTVGVTIRNRFYISLDQWTEATKSGNVIA